MALEEPPLDDPLDDEAAATRDYQFEYASLEALQSNGVLPMSASLLDALTSAALGFRCCRDLFMLQEQDLLDLQLMAGPRRRFLSHVDCVLSWLLNQMCE